MSRSRKRSQSDLADELSPEDGTDPKEFHAKPWDAPKQAGRKSKQLCEQVKDTLNATFPACADPVLQALLAVDVVPAPNSGRLRVRVTADWESLSPNAVVTRLDHAAAMLRGEVARAINRRYAPELTYEAV
jgi:ribosome-binding factor A